jgi:hypothetical protein
MCSNKIVNSFLTNQPSQIVVPKVLQKVKLDFKGPLDMHLHILQIGSLAAAPSKS